MSKIRTREVKKGYIKTIDHAACMSEHVKNTAVKTRLQAEHDNGNEQNNASSYASNYVENAAKQAIGEGVRGTENLTRSARQGIRNIESRVDVKSKADIFFVPEANYEEAINEKKKNNYQIDIVMVKTLSDAVEFLESR